MLDLMTVKSKTRSLCRRPTIVNDEDCESGGRKQDKGYFGPRVGILEDGAYPKRPWKALSETGSKYCVWLPRSYTKDVVVKAAMQWVWKGQGLGTVRILSLPDALLLLPCMEG